MADNTDLDMLDDEGEDEPSEEALAEMAALAEEEARLRVGAEEEARLTSAGAEAALADARRALEAERSATRAAVERYRMAALAAEPELPSELVSGDTLEAVDASLAAARRTVAQIRQRLAEEQAAEGARGFPAGAPERRGTSSEGMSAEEKIASGLGRR